MILSPEHKRILLVLREIKAINPEYTLIQGIGVARATYLLNQLVDMGYVDQHGCAGGITVYTLSSSVLDK